MKFVRVGVTVLAGVLIGLEIAPDERPSGYPVFSACARTNGRPTERAKPSIWCNFPHVRPLVFWRWLIRIQVGAFLASWPTVCSRITVRLSEQSSHFDALATAPAICCSFRFSRDPNFSRPLHKSQQPFATLFPTGLNDTQSALCRASSSPRVRVSADGCAERSTYGKGSR